MSGSAFERRIQPLLGRLGIVERNEEALASRIKNAQSRSVFAANSTMRLLSQFPDVLLPDPFDGEWALRPLDAALQSQWVMRRQTIIETEVPALTKAAEVAAADAADSGSKFARLRQRAEAARRARVAAPMAAPLVPSAPPASIWRRLFQERAEPGEPVADSGVGLADVAKLTDTLVAHGRAAEQQQSGFMACLADMRRLSRRLDALDTTQKD